MDVIIYYIINAVSIIIVTTLFEYIKALMSAVQGDAVPKSQGRLTLNPVKHFEPIGFMLFLFTGFGWANPVETSSRNYKNRKKGTLITYITPIVLLIIFAVVIKIVMNILILGKFDNYYLRLALALLSRNFAAAAVFNIIPVYPMAGSHILRCILSPNHVVKYSQYEKPLQILLVFLLILGVITPVLNAVVEIIV
ncbi:MAG: site-2 protease family protein [Clostridia bacterium]|nr:site-2 protease family protein [Clostridia bacterium]